MRKAIQDFYDKADEDLRLTTGHGVLEFQRTRDIISRYLAHPALKVLDIGGGTGPYSFWLSAQGHTVSLVDGSPKHVQLAKERNLKSSTRLAFIDVGQADSLPFPGEAFDVVLLMGPLYHLHEPQQRLDALRESRRVLKPGGVLLSAYISRFASILDGYQDDYMLDPDFQSIVSADLESGMHRGCADGTTKYFTDAYFHHPEEIKDEAAAAGLNVEELLAVESFGWLIPNFEKYWNDDSERKSLLQRIGRLEKEQSILGLSAHMILVCRK